MRRAHHYAFDNRLSANYDLVFSHNCLTSRGQKTMVAGAASSSRIHLLAVLNGTVSGRIRPGGPGNHYWIVDQLSFCLTAVLPVESLDAAGGVDKLLLAGEERVAIRADLKPDFRLRRPSLPRFTAGAMHGRIHIFWMNVRLHVRGYSCCEFFCQSNVKS
jgi:hypothetical protein